MLYYIGQYVQQTIQMLMGKQVQKDKFSYNYLYKTYQSWRLKLFKRQRVGPYWFFFLFLVKNQIQRQGQKILINWWLFAFNIILDFNVVFMDAGIIMTKQPMLAASLSLFTLLTFCQTKWQKSIYIYSLGAYLLKSESYHFLYLLSASIFMSSQIYRKFPAKSIEQNKGYFTGFIMISIHAFIFLVQQNLSIEISFIEEAIAIFLSFFLINWIFDLKISKMNDFNSAHTQDRFFLFQLRNFREDISSKLLLSQKIKNHNRNCRDTACPCHAKKINSKILIKYLYQKILKDKRYENDSLLYQDYFSFLIECKQHLKAFIFIATQHPISIDGEWMLKKLSMDTEQLKRLGGMQKQFQYALYHDKLRVQMADRMIKIVQYKLKFWGEISHHSPRMIKLQQWSHLIQEEMKQLNTFYNEQIDEIEASLINFNSTILFATFLLSSTNFKEYALQIIKDTTKRLDESLSEENYSSQIYSLSVIYNEKGKLLLSNIEELEKTTDLVIECVSSNFLQMYKLKKQKFIGQSINLLLPQCYRKIHTQMLYQYFNGSSDQRSQMPSFTHSNGVVVPILLAEKTLLMMELQTKVIIHLERSIGFICLFRKMPGKIQTALASFDGKILQREDTIPIQLLRAIQSSKLFQSIQKIWLKEKKIKQQQFEINLKQSIYNITVCSPFDQILANFSFRRIPLHLKVFFEGEKKPVNHINNQQKMVHKIKNIQNGIKSDSQSTKGSKENISAVKILSAFSQRDSVQIYRNIYIYYIVLITAALGALIGTYILNSLPWDNSASTVNPIVDIQHVQRMQQIILHSLGYKLDLDWKQQQLDFDQSKITSYYEQSYQEYSQLQLKGLFAEYNSLIYLSTTQHSAELADELDRRYDVIFDVANFTVEPSAIQRVHQNITFESLLMNYLVDLNLMVFGRNKHLVLLLSFDERVRQLMSCSQLSTIIIESVIKRRQLCIIVLVVSLISIILLLIPMRLFLKNRLDFHEKTFDLMASIEPKSVQMQINSLEYVRNILRHYSQSTEILKKNVIGYQQKVIYPKPVGSQKSSNPNQLVQGLQKYDFARYNSSQKKGQINSDNIKWAFSIYNMSKRQPSMARRRVTELDLSKSQSDPTKKLVISHLPFYLIVLIVLPLIIKISMSFKTQLQSTIEQVNQITSLLQNHSLMQSSLLCLKKYIRHGLGDSSHYCSNKLQSQNVNSYLNLIDSVRLEINGNFEKYSEIYSSCTSASQKNTTCNLDYSYRILEGQILTFSKELIEQRATLELSMQNQLNNQSTTLYSSGLKQLNYRAYYLQTVSVKLDKLYHQILDELTLDIMNQTVAFQKMSFQFLILGILWWVFAFIFGMFWIQTLKRKYFSEVYSLTFLSDQMVLSNKRVQSFLEALQRSSL